MAASKQGDGSPFLDTSGGAMGEEERKAGRKAIRGENHDDRKNRGKQARDGDRTAKQAGVGGRRGEQHARRHEERNAKRERRHDATPHGTKSGTGSEPTKQAERN